MHGSLATVATFNDPMTAAVARNYLADEGIAAVLSDDNTIATDWMLSNAIGGIKLQVPAADFERAEFLLAKLRETVDRDRDAEPESTAIATSEVAEELQAERQEKEPANVIADRLFRSAVFGLLFWPLQFYTLYLLLSLWGTPGKVSPNRRWKVFASALLNLPLMSAVLVPLACLYSVLWPSAPAGPDNPIWRRIDNHEFAYSVKFPYTPDERWTPHDGAGGAIQQYIWYAWSHHRTYQVIIHKPSFPLDNIPAEAQMRQWVDKITSQRKGKIRREETTQLNGIAGKEIWIESPGSHVRERVFIRGREIFEIRVDGTETEIFSDEAEQYFKSLRFL